MFILLQYQSITTLKELLDERIRQLRNSLCAFPFSFFFLKAELFHFGLHFRLHLDVRVARYASHSAALRQISLDRAPSGGFFLS